jgi:branched-chain amino acid transport system permease protein
MNEPASTERSIAGMLTRKALLLSLCTAALLALPAFASIRYVFLTSELLIAILYATSLNLLMGYGGMLSLGQAAYFSLGAYAAALLMTRLAWPMEAAMLAGPLVATLGALVFGIFIVRTSHQEHAYFLMLTLAFSQLVYATLFKWYSVTRGDDGITGITARGLLGDPRNYCYFVVAVVALSLYALRRIGDSPFGATLQAIRDNPQRAAFVGLPVRRYQLLAFVIAGFFAGVAGVLHAFFSGTISPQIADWSASARPFFANTIGGVQSFWGPAVGVLVLEIIDTQVGRLTEHSLLAVGAMALLVGVYLPQGVVGLFTGRGAASQWVPWAPWSRWLVRKPK